MRMLLVVSSVAIAAACSKPASSPAGPVAPAETPVAADGFSAQVDAGATVYGARCASCHGAAGEGGDAPALVGAGALPEAPPEGRAHRKSAFATAADVHAFVRAAMPPGAASELSDADTWAVVAFALKANGVTLAEPLGPANAASVRLH